MPGLARKQKQVRVQIHEVSDSQLRRTVSIASIRSSDLPPP